MFRSLIKSAGVFVSLLLIVETVAGNSQLSRVVRFDPQNMLSRDTKEVLKEETVVCVCVWREGEGGVIVTTNVIEASSNTKTVLLCVLKDTASVAPVVDTCCASTLSSCEQNI